MGIVEDKGIEIKHCMALAERTRMVCCSYVLGQEQGWERISPKHNDASGLEFDGETPQRGVVPIERVSHILSLCYTPHIWLKESDFIHSWQYYRGECVHFPVDKIAEDDGIEMWRQGR